MLVGHLKCKKGISGFIRNNCMEPRSIFSRHQELVEEMMEESKYPIKNIRDRAASSQSGICPNCGSPIVECDGSLMHPGATGKPAYACSREGCSYVCLK
jgi:hypothetical protein